jgi:hypothetical protein
MGASESTMDEIRQNSRNIYQLQSKNLDLSKNIYDLNCQVYYNRNKECECSLVSERFERNRGWCEEPQGYSTKEDCKGEWTQRGKGDGLCVSEENNGYASREEDCNGTWKPISKDTTGYCSEHGTSKVKKEFTKQHECEHEGLKWNSIVKCQW